MAFNPEAQFIKTNFTAGVLGKDLLGRVDLDRYRNAVALLENFVNPPQGGITRRPGVKFAGPQKDQTESCELIEFVKSETDSLVLELSELAMRFWTNGGQLLEASNAITDITDTSPGVWTTTSVHGLSIGEEIFMDAASDVTELNNRNYIVKTVPTTTTMTLEDKFGNTIDTSPFSEWTAGGTIAKVFTLTTTITQAQSKIIQVAQSADVMYITHEDFHPLKLVRTAATTWTIANAPFEDGPFDAENITAITITPSGLTGSITVTASSAIFVATDVGRLIRYKDGATDWGWMEITAFGSTTSVTALVKKDLLGGGASTRWNLGAWSDTTGYPAACAFHEERLVMGGGTNFPQKTWLSWSAEFERFSPTDFDDSLPDDVSLLYNFSTGQTNAIRWYSSGRILAAGTIGGVFRISGSDITEPLTPTSIVAKREVTIGSSISRPLQVGSATLYIQRNERKLREFLYNFEVDGYQSGDLTILANQILRNGARQMAYQQEPHSIVWVVDREGDLHGLTYQKDQQVVGWQDHVIGGVGVNVESIAVIPGTNEDQLWISASITVAGVTNRYVGFLSEFFKIDVNNTKEDAFFPDWGVTYTGAATNTIDNLYHLRNETVSVLVNGKPQPPLTVSATGRLTLPGGITGTKVHIGKGNTCAFETLAPEGGNQLGTSQGKMIHMERALFRCIETLGGKAGIVGSDLNEIKELNDISQMDIASELFDGDAAIDLEGSTFVNDPFKGRIRFENSDPTPTTILAVMPELVVNP